MQDDIRTMLYGACQNRGGNGIVDCNQGTRRMRDRRNFSDIGDGPCRIARRLQPDHLGFVLLYRSINTSSRTSVDIGNFKSPPKPMRVYPVTQPRVDKFRQDHMITGLKSLKNRRDRRHARRKQQATSATF